MNSQMDLEIVLMSSCGKDICCYDRKILKPVLRMNIAMLSSTYIQN